MEIHRLTDAISVAAQISAGDVPAIRDAGFRALLCNRPDRESPGQPDFSEIESAARAAGLEIRYQPVVSGRMNLSDVQAFAQAVGELPGPVLAYCRSGTRCTRLWALSQHGRMPAAEIVATARMAGYDVGDLV
ncbi:TIGR01244 family sulfur transferase [Tropicimonas sp.]|uniref:TIGR01244 family sulfur transferase n=1 Tax=Tropicimonas sp. TaxID=2067044 RepID=UPI003A8498DD